MEFGVILLNVADLGLQEETAGGSGKTDEHTEGATSARAEPVVDLAPMESKTDGEGINAYISDQLMAGLNSNLIPNERLEVNAGEDFSQKINAPRINHTAGLGKDKRDLGDLIGEKHESLDARNKGELLSNYGVLTILLGMPHDCPTNQARRYVEMGDGGLKTAKSVNKEGDVGLKKAESEN
nr:hypothetical protein CFP56_46392 [Quercus suber]